MDRRRKIVVLAAGLVILLVVVFFSLPPLLITYIRNEKVPSFDQFPVTVIPQQKIIVQDARVEAFFDNPNSPFLAAAASTHSVFKNLFEWIALSIAGTPLYEYLAAGDTRMVSVTPGMRKEQIAVAFAGALNWTSTEQKSFLNPKNPKDPVLTEGEFAPGVYVMNAFTSPATAEALVRERFTVDVLSRYGTATASIVPLQEALTVASLVEREAGGTQDMRLISGIIWNRLFINMPLQIDATLQYAKANATGGGAWWPKPLPQDRYVKSSYNTYLHEGLPPGPIASPSVAAILAALNPKQTPCLFYFHDATRKFHCSATYAEHVKLLKQYFGRGK